MFTQQSKKVVNSALLEQSESISLGKAKCLVHLTFSPRSRFRSSFLSQCDFNYVCIHGDEFWPLSWTLYRIYQPFVLCSTHIGYWFLVTTVWIHHKHLTDQPLFAWQWFGSIKKSLSSLIQVVSRILNLHPYISLRLLHIRMHHAACLSAIVSPMRAMSVTDRFIACL